MHDVEYRVSSLVRHTILLEIYQKKSTCWPIRYVHSIHTLSRVTIIPLGSTTSQELLAQFSILQGCLGGKNCGMIFGVQYSCFNWIVTLLQFYAKKLIDHCGRSKTRTWKQLPSAVCCFTNEPPHLPHNYLIVNPGHYNIRRDLIAGSISSFPAHACEAKK